MFGTFFCLAYFFSVILTSLSSQLLQSPLTQICPLNSSTPLCSDVILVYLLRENVFRHKTLNNHFICFPGVTVLYFLLTSI